MVLKRGLLMVYRWFYIIIGLELVVYRWFYNWFGIGFIKSFINGFMKGFELDL